MKSTALQVMELIYKKQMKIPVSKLSWRNTNDSLDMALKSLIIGQIDFDLDDFETIADTMNGGYWFGKDGGSYGERFYSLAIEKNNASAYQSFEKWKNRKPFIIDGNRLHIGYTFSFLYNRLKVTSFNDDDGYVVACEYEKVQKGEGMYSLETSKVSAIHKITHKDIYARNKAIRDREKSARDNTE